MADSQKDDTGTVDASAAENDQPTKETAQEEPKQEGSQDSKKDKKSKKKDKPKKDKKPRKPAEKRFTTPVLVIAIVAALVVGVLGGVLAYRTLPIAGSPVVLSGNTTISEGQLDTVVATYTYDGETHDITARDAIEENSSLEAAKNDDGTYNVPSADTILATARYQIIDLEATKQGIEVSDDDIASYAEDTVGSSDYATIASTYNMDEDQVKEIMRQSAVMKKLHDQVVTGDEPTQPMAPTAPADGQEDTPTADYAQYIINLVGDEWDSANNTWARTDGDYYAALSSYTISNDSATYDAAQAAYIVAAQKYSQAESEYTSQWSSYVNGLLSNASISIGTMVVSS